MTKVPAPPYVGPANRHGGKGNKPIKRIVLHSTVGPTKPGSARSIARMFNTTSRAASAHYIVDGGEVVQDLYDSYVAYHAPPNSNSLGVEICDNPGPSESRPYSADRWESGDHRKALLLTAELVAGLCKAYGIPIRKLSSSDLRAGKQGICGHVDISYAWSQTSHWDPGKFPWSDFIRLVKKAAKGEDIGAEVIDASDVSGGTSGGGGKYESPTAKHEVGSRVMGLYDGGTDVNWLQRRLPKVGYSAGAVDGYFGPSVEKAVKKFQKAAGVAVDGLVGKNALAALKAADEVAEAPKQKPKGKVPGKKYAFPYESRGYIGPKSGPAHSHSGIGGYKTNGVLDRTWNKRFVNQLEERGWDPEGDYLVKYGNDGKYGDELESLIRAFQKDQGLTEDGLGGPDVWGAAFNNPVT